MVGYLASYLQSCINGVHVNLVVDSSTVGHYAQMGRLASKLHNFPRNRNGRLGYPLPRIYFHLII